MPNPPSPAAAATDPSDGFRYRQPQLEHVEDVERYVPGGYHPIDIGDKIANNNNGRDVSYTVIHKLGHGGFSTVWLVKQQRQETEASATPSLHALKVLCSNLGDMSDDAHEPSILKHLGQVSGGDRHPNIVTLEDSFTVSGPNGQHRCLVFPFLGPNLLSPQVTRALTPAARQRVCRQLASAVAHLHAHGVCHGDLTPSNVVFQLPGIESLTESSLHELLGPLKTENLRLRDRSRSKHGPRQVVAAATLSGLDLSSLSSIQIVDFGQAFMASHTPPTLGCPVEFFPPELCFGYPASTKGDVWQLASLLFVVQTNHFLFQTFFQVFEALIGFAVRYLGPVPGGWKGKFMADKYGYQDPLAPRRIGPSGVAWWFEKDGPGQSGTSLLDRLAQEAPHLSRTQRQALERLILDMVTWEPGHRISAVEVTRRLESLAPSGEKADIGGKS